LSATFVFVSLYVFYFGVPAIYHHFYDGFSGGCADKAEGFPISDLEVLCGLGVFWLVWWLGDEVVVDLAVSDLAVSAVWWSAT
jgi:hypothetical protein